MAENLRTTRNNSGQYVDYYSSAMGSDEAYGLHYNWYTANDEICPEGWHLPSDQEFQELELYLGMDPSELNATGSRHSGSVGGKMKEIGNEHWESPNHGATNESEFTALPAGYVQWQTGNSHYNEGQHAYYWTSSSHDGTRAWARDLYSSHAGVDRPNYDKNYSYSIRCVRD